MEKDLTGFWAAASKLTRREFLQWTTTGSIALSLADLVAWVDQAAAQGTKGELIVASWGGSTQALHKKYFFEPFAKTTGIKVIDVSPFSYGKLKSMVEARHPEWDVTITTDVGEAKRAANEGLLEPIDYSIVHAQDLDPRARGSHWCAGEFEAVVIGYHKQAFPTTHPMGWADFWNVQKFPGTRALHNWVVTTMEAALLADGVDPKSLYPLDIDRAFRSLDRIKPHIKVWWDVSAQGQSQQLIKDREVDLIDMWTGRIGTLILGGAPVGMEYSQALFTIAPWVVVKGARNLKNAMLFIDFISRPEPQAGLHSELIYGPTNTKAFRLIKPEIARLLPSYPANLAKSIEVNTDYWQANEGPVTEKFNAWLLKK